MEWQIEMLHSMTSETKLPGPVMLQDDPQFEFMFKNVWANNADVLSKQYTTTGALKSDFTR
jgi:hypothetical protein